MLTTLAIHTRHDANLAIMQGNKVVLYIEFEKLTKKRYFAFSEDPVIFERECVSLILPKINYFSIDKIILSWVSPQQENILRKIFSAVKTWNLAHHHIAHAWSTYVFTDPLEGDLLLSYDGGGDLGDYFKVFQCSNGEIVLLKDVKINLGRSYRLLGLLSPELYKPEKDSEYSLKHALSGKIMALAALGSVIDKYKEPLHYYFVNFEKFSLEDNFKILLEALGFKNKKFLSVELSRDVLATAQKVFEEIVEVEFYPFISAKNKPTRILISGGCALNVTMNSKISERFNVPIFVAPCPNDCGISLGALKLYNKMLEKISIPYCNIFPTNQIATTDVESRLNLENFDMVRMAQLLAEGKVLGTIREKLEIGPRALGNRSYLANPIIEGMKDNVNLMKGREFWRPVAPIVLAEDLEKYFITNQLSPYMSFAPKVRSKYATALKEIVHLDGTARVQTVSPADGWIYELLREFKKISGFGILMNTSFNIKGEPLINDEKDALRILESTSLDGIVTKNYIILKRNK